MTRARRVTAAAPLLAVLAGCTVGPHYGGPPDVAPASRARPAFHRAGVAPVTPAPPLARWWTALGDHTLDRVEGDALANSPTLERALGVVRESRATARERRAALLPKGGATAAYARVGVPGAITNALGDGLGGTGVTGGGAGGGSGFQVPNNLFDVGLLATWEIDLFGGARRQAAAARAQLQASEADLQDGQVTLTREVATAYVNLRDAQARLALARADAATEQRMLDLTKLRRASGAGTDLDVERLFAQLRQTQATAVPLAAQVEIYTDQLSQLAGHEPGTLDSLVASPQPLPIPPAETAVGDPADLLRRRPDIRAAERRLAGANEDIGARIAQYFPTVNLFGTLGFGSDRVSNLFSGDNLVKLAAPVLQWNVLNFPTVRAQVGEARARFDQARAAYRAAVLSALLDAENALSRYGHERDNVASLADASASAARASAKTDLRYRAGTVTLIDALDAERQRIQAQSRLAEAQAQLTTDWIALQTSLGLGWGAGVAAGAPA